MQPRPSENQQRPSLPALHPLVPSRPTQSHPRDSVSGARVPVAGDLVIGALSPFARNKNISRDLPSQALPSQAWSTGTVSRDDLSPQQSRHWWRVDGRHGSIDDSASFREQGMPDVGVFYDNIDLGLQSLLFTQLDVCPTLPSDVGKADETNARAGTQTWVLENTRGVLPKVVCGLHQHVSQNVLSALGIDGSMSVTCETPAVLEKVGKKYTVPESAVPELGGCLRSEIEFGGRTSNGPANALVSSELLHLR